MRPMDDLLIVLGMALVTYATRVGMIVALGWKSFWDDEGGPSLLRRWLRYVPPAVLAALIAPPILAPQGQIELGLPLWAATVGAGVAWYTRSPFWAILSGMMAFWVLRILGG